MSATATTEKRTGQQKVLATYQCHEGERQLVGQRVNGTVHISDIPTGEQGRVYLVEQNLITMGELQAIVDDYTPPRPPSSATPRCRRGSNASRRALYPGARLATRVRTHRSA